jgi:hypothetical protein
MRFTAVHDRHGNIAALTASPPDAPPATLVTDAAGELVTEVEVPEEIIDLTEPENEQRVVEVMQDFRVEVKTEGRLVRKSSSNTG